MRERDIESHLVRCVRAKGGECRKVKWIAHSGAPDRVVFIGTRTAFVELKAPGKKPEKHQLREHARLRARGLYVVIIDSLEGVEQLCDELTK